MVVLTEGNEGWAICKTHYVHPLNVFLSEKRLMRPWFWQKPHKRSLSISENVIEDYGNTHNLGP